MFSYVFVGFLAFCCFVTFSVHLSRRAANTSNTDVELHYSGACHNDSALLLRFCLCGGHVDTQQRYKQQGRCISVFIRRFLIRRKHGQRSWDRSKTKYKVYMVIFICIDMNFAAEELGVLNWSERNEAQIFGGFGSAGWMVCGSEGPHVCTKKSFYISIYIYVYIDIYPYGGPCESPNLQYGGSCGPPSM